jgi:hypothetical protein
VRPSRISTVLAGLVIVMVSFACGGDVRNFRDIDDVPPDFPLEVDAYRVTAACASRSYADGPVMGHQILAEPRFDSIEARQAQIDVWVDELKADGWTVRTNELYFGRDDDQLDIDIFPGDSDSLFLTWWTPGCDHEDGDLLDE